MQDSWEDARNDALNAGGEILDMYDRCRKLYDMCTAGLSTGVYVDTFTWNDFINGKIAVHCASDMLAESFFNAARKRGLDVDEYLDLNIETDGNTRYFMVGGTILDSCGPGYCLRWGLPTYEWI